MTLVQIYAIISLLLAFGVDPSITKNVQNILQHAPSPVQTQEVPMDIGGIGQTVAPTPVPQVANTDCVSDPALTLSVSESGRPGWPTFSGSYVTGCAIDPSTPWSISIYAPYAGQDHVRIRNEVGTLGDKLPHTVKWNLQGNAPGQSVYNIGYFSESGNIPLNTVSTFEITVGSVTKSVVFTPTL